MSPAGVRSQVVGDFKDAGEVASLDTGDGPVGTVGDGTIQGGVAVSDDDLNAGPAISAYMLSATWP